MQVNATSATLHEDQSNIFIPRRWFMNVNSVEVERSHLARFVGVQ